MEHDNALLRKWATTSRRLNVGLLCVLVLAVVLLSICYWALERVLQEERDKVHFHFSRLVGAIHEHEAFLSRIAQKSDNATQTKDQDSVPVQRQLLMRESGVEIYRGREFSFAMPFTLATLRRETDEDARQGPFALGVLLANFYGSFWSLSAYPAPQLMLFGLDGDTSLAVPVIDTTPARGGPRDTYPELALRVFARLQERLPGVDDPRVHWARADRYRGEAQELLGYVRVELPPALWWSGEPVHSALVASLLDLARVNDFEQLMARPVFADISLRSPAGEMLLGKAPPATLDDGLSFTGDGLVMRLRSQPEGGWEAVYRIAYGSFFRHAQWPLLGLLLLLPGCLVAGWLGLRWYARWVVRPVHRAHRQLVESETFSRTLIQAAPVALAVLSQDGRQLVTRNQLAEQWLGSDADILALTTNWRLFDSHGQPPGELCTEVGGRCLQAAFAATRYAGEEAVLCVFNDVSVHREAEVVLASAKRSADAASQAKTLFLASMSHEIRTPLYGVLGTLELLGLTSLDTRQRTYLRTIQGASSTLLQLISDILDVSKIETGQMALNPEPFSPLELVEEVLRGYAASAAAKHLQFYGCVDVEVPAQLLGDVARIRQVLNNLVSNALKFTDIGRVVLRLRVLAQNEDGVSLQWQVADTGMGIAEDQQARLFEAFYQVPGAHHASGTGLGLSISASLARMMGGSLRVVSELGLGSSFSLLLELPVEGRRGSVFCPAPLRQGGVYVQSPVRELADNVAAWLECWGCSVLSGEPSAEAAEGAVLLELLPPAAPRPWTGPRVRALVDAPGQPELHEDGWHVSLYSLAGIARALARAQGSEVLEPVPAQASEGPGQLGLRVLIAEDNPVNQELLREQLEELGCIVSLAGDGLQALQLFDARRFDVLLTDVNMPNMSGYELTQELRGRGECIPIIGVTANAMREEGERCRAVGMNAWLVKPISLQTLYDRLRTLVAGESIPEPEPEPSPPGEAVPSLPVGASPLQVPERMRELFLQSMGKDLQVTRAALARAEPEALRQGVHRMAGALAVVRAVELVTACRAVEEGLLEGRLSCSAAEVEQLLDDIGQALRDLAGTG
ncbi:response regulator [Pseudomonas citronellolis]|jgi:two-component system capsular synthesis sensor histidine kinase RcsC|uniref:hybrid sensor histidine kinase/response regulator n=1 Tax=Pseudomonas citronellolis TaxID=53408 RepID=UPI003C2F5BDA